MRETSAATINGSSPCDVLAGPARRGFPSRDVALALLTGVLLAVSMPGEVTGLLAWGALAPLVIATAGRSPSGAAGFGYFAGVVSAFATYRWVFFVPGFGPAHATLLALWLALLPSGAPSSRSSNAGRLAVVAGGALSGSPEWVRAHAGFLAFPWGSLAQTQHADLPLRCSWPPSPGSRGFRFSWLAAGVALGRIVVARAWREAAAVGSGVAVAHLAGALVLTSTQPGPHPLVTVAIVQPSIQAAERTTGAGYLATIERLERLTRTAAAVHPDLVLWPETAVRGLSVDEELRRRLERLAREVGAPILAGSSHDREVRGHGLRCAALAAPQ